MKTIERMTDSEKQIFDHVSADSDRKMIEISKYAEEAGFMVKTFMTGGVAYTISESDILPMMKMLYGQLEKSFGYQPVIKFNFIKIKDGYSRELRLCSVLVLGKEPVIIISETE